MQQQANANVTAGNVISTNPVDGYQHRQGQHRHPLRLHGRARTILLPNVKNEQYNSAAQSSCEALGFTNVNPVADNQSTLPNGRG